jgi:hypothetical protein
MPRTRRAPRPWFGIVFVALAVAGLAGCGRGGPYPVSGRLEYEDGEPITGLAGSTVTFTSDALGVEARGEIQEDGTFRLGTRREADGAPPGTYKVIVTQPHPEPERRVTGHPVVALIYEDPKTTPLEVTVEPKSNDFTLKLKRLKAGR